MVLRVLADGDTHIDARPPTTSKRGIHGLEVQQRRPAPRQSQTHVRLRRLGVREEGFGDGEAGVDLQGAEMRVWAWIDVAGREGVVEDPGVVDVFDAVDYGAAGEGEAGMGGVGVRR